MGGVRSTPSWLESKVPLQMFFYIYTHTKISELNSMLIRKLHVFSILNVDLIMCNSGTKGQKFY